MKLIVRRKVAVSGGLPRGVTSGRTDQKLAAFIEGNLRDLMVVLAADASKDGQESGDVLVEVTDEGAQ